MLTQDLMIPSTVTVDDVEITYYDSEDTRNHPDDVLVLVHGTAGTTASHFGFLYPVLASRQRVVAIDWSQVDPNRPLELEDLVDQVTSTIKELLPGRKVILLGYSLGAVVTAKIAADHPELIKRLILVAGWIRTDLQQILRNDVWQALRASGDEQTLRSYSTFCAFGGPFLATKTMADMQPGMDAMSFDEFGDQQMELNRRIDITTEAEQITAPTLVISCIHDQMVPTRHQLALFGAIKDSRFVEIPTGHAVVFERPSELSHHIQQFMDKPEQYDAGTIIPTPKP
ncbi:alpha/beta fold hydrolase [Pseudoglutamicibacter cumminsii]|uniref:alpha/beta fold hydrolase n=1 Tax=Pseudoglutamicibacter cumminsii TaxID=156979 RepID=UPI0021A6570F|nr:alpha/beta hydrolase [Pseudoglutamicibacter cumminsii]MCT1686743.1 alpha/beta hydrolase [Pseudoglutamicibacter cumminsii]